MIVQECGRPPVNTGGVTAGCDRRATCHGGGGGDVPDGSGQQETDEVQGLTEEVERLRSRFPAYPVRYLYILMAVAAVEAADRTILSTVMEDVKHAFHV